VRPTVGDDEPGQGVSPASVAFAPCSRVKPLPSVPSPHSRWLPLAPTGRNGCGLETQRRPPQWQTKKPQAASRPTTCFTCAVKARALLDQDRTAWLREDG